MKHPKGDWIAPPGLKSTAESFILACRLISAEAKETGRRTPLMIYGPTGTGKSFFIEIATRFFERDYGGKEPERINCATLKDEFVHSELFGHVKGAYTGAVTDKIGIVEKAGNGLLILDEIGELTQELQAKLLTFIEDKHYYRLGGTIRREAKDLQIVATTNRTRKDFREDFWYRFYPFPVPPLYRHRGDILYYLFHSHPAVFRSLMPYEILRLLAYNWPGNVREIETFGRHLRKRMLESDFEINRDLEDTNIDSDILGTGRSRVNLSRLALLLDQFAINLVNHDEINQLLGGRSACLSLTEGEKAAFKESFTLLLGDFELDGVKLNMYNLEPQLDSIYEMFQVFCWLFLQEAHHHGDLFDVASWKRPCVPNSRHTVAYKHTEDPSDVASGEESRAPEVIRTGVYEYTKDCPTLLERTARFALRMITENNRPARKDPELVYELVGYPTIDSPNEPLYIESWVVEPKADRERVSSTPPPDRGIVKLDRLLEEINSDSLAVDQPEVSLESAIRGRKPFPTMDEADREYLETVIKLSDGVISEAARRAGLERSTFVNRCKRLGISPYKVSRSP